MRWHLQLIMAFSLFALASASPQTSRAENFTSGKFLKYSADGQKSFIEISITMAGAIAAQTKPNLARCLDNWYFADQAVQSQRIDHILATMREFPEYHPSGVVLAVLQKACGPFKNEGAD